MIRSLVTLTLLAAASAAAQEPQAEPYYARAYYTKWKPGKQAEGQSFVKDVPSKAALNWVKKQPGAIGQITMSRVLPGGGEITHDRLRLAIYSKPPDLGGADQPGAAAFLEGTGMSPAAYSAGLRSLFDTARTEIWQSVFRHGSIQQGDYVRVTWSKVPSEHFAARLDYLRTWMSGMYAQVAKRGTTARGLESWQIRNAAEEQPSLIGLMAFPDSEATYKTLGSEQDDFRNAHPGKSYNTYRQAADAAGRNAVSVQIVVYRVDLAVWK